MSASTAALASASQGPVLLADINDKADDEVIEAGSFPELLTPFKDGVLMRASVPNKGQWWYNDAVAETATALTTPLDGELIEMAVLDDGVALAAFSTEGEEDALWVTDGSVSGTRQLTGPSSEILLGLRAGPFAWNGKAWFLARSIEGVSGVWSTDGTDEGTRLEAAFDKGTAAQFGLTLGRFHATKDNLFIATDPIGEPGIGHLFTVDVASSELIDLGRFSGKASPIVDESIEFGGRLMFAGDDGQSGVEPWSTDGSLAGTTLLLDINTGSGDSNPYFLDSDDTRLFFAAFEASTG